MKSLKSLPIFSIVEFNYKEVGILIDRGDESHNALLYTGRIKEKLSYKEHLASKIPETNVRILKNIAPLIVHELKKQKRRLS